MILKRLLLISILLGCATMLNAQRRSSHFIDIATGSTNAVEPYTVGYRSPTFGFFHASFGYRYMMNTRFGYRLLGAYDQLKNAPGRSLPFNSDYFRVSGELVVDAGEVLGFKEFTRFFGLLLHGGAGYSGLSGNHHYTSMAHMLSGLTLEMNANRSPRFTLDVTRVNSVYQQWTFDMMNPYNEVGFDGMIFNVTLGVSIRL